MAHGVLDTNGKLLEIRRAADKAHYMARTITACLLFEELNKLQDRWKRGMGSSRYAVVKPASEKWIFGPTICTMYHIHILPNA